MDLPTLHGLVFRFKKELASSPLEITRIENYQKGKLWSVWSNDVFSKNTEKFLSNNPFIIQEVNRYNTALYFKIGQAPLPYLYCHFRYYTKGIFKEYSEEKEISNYVDEHTIFVMYVSSFDKKKKIALIGTKEPRILPVGIDNFGREKQKVLLRKKFAGRFSGIIKLGLSPSLDYIRRYEAVITDPIMDPEISHIALRNWYLNFDNLALKYKKGFFTRPLFMRELWQIAFNIEPYSYILDEMFHELGITYSLSLLEVNDQEHLRMLEKIRKFFLRIFKIAETKDELDVSDFKVFDRYLHVCPTCQENIVVMRYINTVFLDLNTKSTVVGIPSFYCETCQTGWNKEQFNHNEAANKIRLWKKLGILNAEKYPQADQIDTDSSIAAIESTDEKFIQDFQEQEKRKSIFKSTKKKKMSRKEMIETRIKELEKIVLTEKRKFTKEIGRIQHRRFS